MNTLGYFAEVMFGIFSATICAHKRKSSALEFSVLDLVHPKEFIAGIKRIRVRIKNSTTGRFGAVLLALVLLSQSPVWAKSLSGARFVLNSIYSTL